MEQAIAELFSRVRRIELLLSFIAGAQLLNIGNMALGLLKP